MSETDEKNAKLGAGLALMVLVTFIVLRSTTETVPVTAEPLTGSATISVPAEKIWESACVAGRPPSLLT